MHRISFKAALLASALIFQTGSMMTTAYAQTAASLPASNPLAAETTLPYGAPQFDKIKDTLRVDGFGTFATCTELPPPAVTTRPPVN